MTHATLIAEAVERAVASRGTVMLGVRGDERRWCCVCAATDGSLEVRVGEPPRGWRRWRPSDGERWLQEHGFTHRVDAWVAVTPRGVGERWCLVTLQAALDGALSVGPDAALVEVLSHPGIIDGRTAPPPSAARADHIDHALRSLVAHGRGMIAFELGRPSHPAAWVFAGPEGLTLSPAGSSEAVADLPERTVALHDSAVTDATRGLLEALARDGGHAPSDPLFVSFIDL